MLYGVITVLIAIVFSYTCGRYSGVCCLIRPYMLFFIVVLFGVDPFVCFFWHVCPGRHPQMATTWMQAPPPGGTQFIARKVSAVLIEVIVICLFGLSVFVKST